MNKGILAMRTTCGVFNTGLTPLAQQTPFMGEYHAFAMYHTLSDWTGIQLDLSGHKHTSPIYFSQSHV